MVTKASYLTFSLSVCVCVCVCTGVCMCVCMCTGVCMCVFHTRIQAMCSRGVQRRHYLYLYLLVPILFILHIYFLLYISYLFTYSTLHMHFYCYFALLVGCLTAFRCLSTCTLCNDNKVESNLI